MELRDPRWREACRSRRTSPFQEAAFETSYSDEAADAFEPFEWELVRSIAVAERALFSANFARRLLTVGKALFPREEATFSAKFAKASFSKKCNACF